MAPDLSPMTLLRGLRGGRPPPTPGAYPAYFAGHGDEKSLAGWESQACEEEATCSCPSEGEAEEV